MRILNAVCFVLPTNDPFRWRGAQHESLRKLTLEDLVLEIHFPISLYCLVILIRTTKSRRRTSVARDRITISKSKSSSSWPISSILYCVFLPDWNSFRFSVKDPLPLNFTCNHEWKHYSVFAYFLLIWILRTDRVSSSPVFAKLCLHSLLWQSSVINWSLCADIWNRMNLKYTQQIDIP